MSDDLRVKIKGYRRAAHAAANSGDRDRARALYVAMASEDADNKLVVDESAGALATMGYVDDAVGILEDALKRFGERPGFLSRLAQILTGAQRWADANGVLRRLLARVWDMDAAVMLGQSLTMSGALDEAEIILRKAIAADPAVVAPYAHLATVLIKRGKAMDALTAADTALACGAKPSTHCLRGDILLAMGQPILAAMAFQRALDMAPDYPPALAGLAEVKARQPLRPRVMAYGQRVLVQNAAHGGAQYLAASWTAKTEFRK